MDEDRDALEPWSHTEVPPSIDNGPPAQASTHPDADATQKHLTPSPKRHGAHPFGDDAGLDVHLMRRVAATAEKKLRPSSAGRLRPLSAASVRTFGTKHELDVTSMSIHGHGSTAPSAAQPSMGTHAPNGPGLFRLAHGISAGDRAGAAVHHSPAPFEIVAPERERLLSPSRHHAAGEPALRRPMSAASLTARAPLHVASVMLPLPSSISSLSQAGIRLGRRTNDTHADIQRMPGESGILAVAGRTYGTSVQVSTAQSAAPPARPPRASTSQAKNMPSAASPQRNAHAATTVGMILEARGNGMRPSRPSTARDLLNVTTPSCVFGGTAGTATHAGSVHVGQQPSNAHPDVRRQRPQSAHAQLHATTSYSGPSAGRATAATVHKAADASRRRVEPTRFAPQLTALFTDAGIEFSPPEVSSELDEVGERTDTTPIPVSLATAAADGELLEPSSAANAPAPVRSRILRSSPTAGPVPPIVESYGRATDPQPAPPNFGASKDPGTEPRSPSQAVRTDSFNAPSSAPASSPHVSHARSAVLSWPSATSLKANLPAAYDDRLRRDIHGPAVHMLAEGVRLGGAVTASPKPTAFQERYSLASKEGPLRSGVVVVSSGVVAHAVTHAAPPADASRRTSIRSRPPSATARVLQRDAPPNVRSHYPQTVDAVVDPHVAAYERAVPGQSSARARATRPLSASARLQSRNQSGGLTSFEASGDKLASAKIDDFAPVRFRPSVSFSRLLSSSLDVPLSLQHVLEHAAGLFGGVPTRPAAASLQRSMSASCAVAQTGAHASPPRSGATTHNIRWRSSSTRRLLPYPHGGTASPPALRDAGEPLRAGKLAGRGARQLEGSSTAAGTNISRGVPARQQQFATIALQPTFDATDTGVHTRRRLSYSSSLAAGQPPFKPEQNGIHPPGSVRAENVNESLRLLEAALRAPMPPALESKVDDDCAIEIRARPHAAFSTETEASLLAAAPPEAKVADLLPNACAFPSAPRRSLSPRQRGASVIRALESEGVKTRDADAIGVAGPRLLSPPDQGINLMGKALTRTLRPRSAIPRLPTMGLLDHKPLAAHEAVPTTTHERARCASGKAVDTRASPAHAQTVHKRRRSTGEAAVSQQRWKDASFSHVGLFDPWIPLKPFSARQKEIDSASECHSSRTPVAAWDEHDGTTSHFAAGEVIQAMRNREAEERKLEL